MASFTSPTPHFFKVILHRTLKQQKLEIPKKFVRDYGLQAFLSTKTCLKVADGLEWNVGFAKRNGRVWFDDGWQKFVQFYSVGLGYFLVFRYESQSTSFRVVIFDNSATEIEYPVKRIHLDKAGRRMKKELDVDDNLELVFGPPEDFKVGRDSLSVGRSMKSEQGGMKQPLTTSQRKRAMAKATDFQSTALNPSFICKISPSHIHPGKSLHVPGSFAAMHLNLEGPIELNLEVSDGRIWNSRCGVYGITHRIQRRTMFGRGWKRFARDNCLQVGDVCVFEMIKKNGRRISLKVHIFKAS